MAKISDDLLQRISTLLAFAVYVHVESNGTDGKPVKADGGWEDAFELMQKLEDEMEADDGEA